MVDQKDLQNNRVEIGQVREASFDPVIGESVVLALRVRSSSTQLAASNVGVIFTDGTTPWRVVTDEHGWADLKYEAKQQGNVVVTATLDSVNNDPEAAPLHTFRFKALAAGVWDDARFQLNAEPATVWGAETRFPRLSQSHTVKLSVNANSPLLDRYVCLGLKGYSSANELGLTVAPELGKPQLLTSNGLTWRCSGTIGGAYALQLEASRLLKQSPVNAMSLGVHPVRETDPQPGEPSKIKELIGVGPPGCPGQEFSVRATIVSASTDEPLPDVWVNWDFPDVSIVPRKTNSNGIAATRFTLPFVKEGLLEAVVEHGVAGWGTKSLVVTLDSFQVQRVVSNGGDTVTFGGTVYAYALIGSLATKQPVDGVEVFWIKDGIAQGSPTKTNIDGLTYKNFSATVVGDMSIKAQVRDPQGTLIATKELIVSVIPR
nr:hypothetical protein [Pseudomonas caspiana]